MFQCRAEAMTITDRSCRDCGVMGAEHVTAAVSTVLAAAGSGPVVCVATARLLDGASGASVGVVMFALDLGGGLGTVLVVFVFADFVFAMAAVG